MAEPAPSAAHEPPVPERDPHAASFPATLLPHEHAALPQPAEGTGLCLSGGGYRAMLFHLGVFVRLNELGILRTLDRISSVSGGSITSATVGLRWKRLRWETRTIPTTATSPERQIQVAANFDDEVVRPVRALAGHTIDTASVIEGILRPFETVSEEVQHAYGRYLFGDATLQDLPGDDEGPRFVINATNLQSGVLWRFSRPYMADYRVGMVPSPTIPLTLAVAASSAFPPVLAPARMKLPDGLVQATGAPGEDLHQPPYTTDISLVDGGVYDNLGLETVWKKYRTVLVSDGGGQLAAAPRPHGDWVSVTNRVLQLVDGQVCSLRKRQIVDSLEAGERRGAYWRTRGDITQYPAPGTLPCPLERTQALAAIHTRLQAMDDVTQERLINWGYALSDAAIRAHVDPALPPPSAFPYPDAAV